MRDQAGSDVLASFRPTLRQVVGQGLRRGALVSAVLAGAGAVAALWDLVHIPTAAWVVGTAGPLLVGAVDGAVRGREVGVDADSFGLQLLPVADRPRLPWGRVADLRAERRGRRTMIALVLDDGSTIRPPAPYDSVLLGRDPHFDRKLFVLRHLWETHRRCGTGRAEH